MLVDGERGAVLQRDKTTYALVPHLPLGIVTPSQLRKIAEVAEKYQAHVLKITSATRIAIVGIKEEHINAAWQELGMSPGAAVGLCVRSIKACPGNNYCRLGQQDSLALGKELDKRYHGVDLPSKFKIGVSGCLNQCAESGIKDLGFVGKKNGWTVMVGGNAASHPEVGQALVENLTMEQALAITENIFRFYKENGKKGERLGRFIKKLGFDAFKAAVSGV